MLYGKIKNINKKISKIILGNDVKKEYLNAIKLWDHFFNKGGNTFDNSMYYNEGKYEVFLGNWIKSRKIEKEIVIISKGGNNETKPNDISYLIKKTLDRLKLDVLDIFILHRDNENIPVGEFIDAFNEQINLGLIKSFGASNWKIERFEKAVLWSNKNNRVPFEILNNNLSLAKMMYPLWEGCITSNNKKYLSFLSNNNQSHFSWSSQARGFFIEDNFLKKIVRNKHNTNLRNCFLSKENLERKIRAKKLSKKHDCSVNDIALAWVINQNFPSFAIVGSKNINQLNFSLKSLKIKLSLEEIKWLNLSS